MISAHVTKCMKLLEFPVPQNKSARHAQGRRAEKLLIRLVLLLGVARLQRFAKNVAE